MSIRLEIVVTYRPDVEPTERLEAANFRERALDLAIAEIDEKTDLNIERAKHRPGNRLGFAIKTQSIPNGSTVRCVKPKSVPPPTA
jgi:hypothetical protein